MKRSRFALAAVVLLLAARFVAAATFAPPADVTPYLPANNQATVTGPLHEPFAPQFDIYFVVQTGQPFAVPAGTPTATVLKKAGASWAWMKLMAAEGPAVATDFNARLTAANWFAANVAPQYQP